MADRLDRYRRSSLGELLLAQQAAQSAIDSLPDAVIVFGATGDVLIVNNAGESVLGIGGGSGTMAALDRVQPTLRALIEQARNHVLGGKGAYAPHGFEDAALVPSQHDGDLYYLARHAGVRRAGQHHRRARDPAGRDAPPLAAMSQEQSGRHRLPRVPCADLVADGSHLCLERLAGPLTEKQSDLLFAFCPSDCEASSGSSMTARSG
jgi:hypothetical protein